MTHTWKDWRDAARVAEKTLEHAIAFGADAFDPYYLRDYRECLEEIVEGMERDAEDPDDPGMYRLPSAPPPAHIRERLADLVPPADSVGTGPITQYAHLAAKAAAECDVAGAKKYLADVEKLIDDMADKGIW